MYLIFLHFKRILNKKYLLDFYMGEEIKDKYKLREKEINDL